MVTNLSLAGEALLGLEEIRISSSGPGSPLGPSSAGLGLGAGLTGAGVTLFSVTGVNLSSSTCKWMCVNLL